MDQAWWCGYPGCQITGECAQPGYGPCYDEDGDDDMFAEAAADQAAIEAGEL